MGRSNLLGFASADFLSADEHWDVGSFTFEFGENFLQALFFSAARCIVKDGFIGGNGVAEVADFHGNSLPTDSVYDCG